MGAPGRGVGGPCSVLAAKATFSSGWGCAGRGGRRRGGGPARSPRHCLRRRPARSGEAAQSPAFPFFSREMPAFLEPPQLESCPGGPTRPPSPRRAEEGKRKWRAGGGACEAFKSPRQGRARRRAPRRGQQGWQRQRQRRGSTSGRSRRGRCGCGGRGAPNKQCAQAAGPGLGEPRRRRVPFAGELRRRRRRREGGGGRGPALSCPAAAPLRPRGSGRGRPASDAEAAQVRASRALRGLSGTHRDWVGARRHRRRCRAGSGAEQPA